MTSKQLASLWFSESFLPQHASTLRKRITGAVAREFRDPAIADLIAIEHRNGKATAARTLARRCALEGAQEFISELTVFAGGSEDRYECAGRLLLDLATKSAEQHVDKLLRQSAEQMRHDVRATFRGEVSA